MLGAQLGGRLVESLLGVALLALAGRLIFSAIYVNNRAARSARLTAVTLRIRVAPGEALWPTGSPELFDPPPPQGADLPQRVVADGDSLPNELWG